MLHAVPLTVGDGYCSCSAKQMSLSPVECRAEILDAIRVEKVEGQFLVRGIDMVGESKYTTVQSCRLTLATITSSN